MTLKVSNFDSLVGNDIYLGDLRIDQPINYSRSISFWPQGGSGGSLSTGTVTLDNRDGRYDYLITEPVRDKEIAVRQNGQTLFVGIIDDLDAPDDFSVRFRVKDVLTKLDQPMQRLVYGDEADNAVRDKILPTVLGVVRNIRPTLYDAVDASVGPGYRITDFTLSGVINVRDTGIELATAGFEFDTRIANSGIIINVEPSGTLTCDASTAGGDDFGTVDRFSSAGLFVGTEVGSSGFRSTDASPLSGTLLVSFWKRVRTSNDDGIPGNPYKISFGNQVKMTNPDSTAAFMWLYTATNNSTLIEPLTSGKTYRLQFEVKSFVGGGDRNTRGRFRIRLSGSERVVFEIDAQRGTIDGATFITDFIVSESTDQGLILSLEGFGPEIVLSDLVVFEANAPIKTALTGITLPNYMKEVVFRANESITKINQTDLTTIAGTAQAQLGYYTDQPVTALSVMRRALDSYTSVVYSDRSGNIRFGQLRDPAATNTSFLIDRTRLLAPPRVSVDTAPGLTSQITARKNQYQFRDSDFADNLTAIPLELRQSYSQPAQFTAQAAIPEGFPTIYAHAIDAEPLDSVYDIKSDASAEIQRVINLYSQPRLLVDVEIALDVDEYVELNDIVLLQFPRYGFNDGVNFLVVGVDDIITERHGKRTARLTLWGSTGKNFTPALPPAPDPAIIAILVTEGSEPILTEDGETIGVTA